MISDCSIRVAGGLRLVIDTNRQRRVLGLVQGFGDHDRDRLAEKPDLVVLQDVQPLAGGWIDEALVLPVRQVGARSGGR